MVSGLLVHGHAQSAHGHTQTCNCAQAVDSASMGLRLTALNAPWGVKAQPVYGPSNSGYGTPSLKNESGLYGRFVKTKRSIHSAYASMLVGLAECLPLGILQVRTVL